MTLRLCYFAVIGIVVSSGSPAKARADSSAIGRAELVENAAKSWSSVERCLFEFEGTPSAGTHGIPVHVIVALAAPGEFYHLTAHFPPANPWQVDPFCKEDSISHGTICHQWPFNRMYREGHLRAGDGLVGAVEFGVLLSVIPAWPVTEYKSPSFAPAGVSLIPLEAMRSADYRLLPGVERIAGEDCTVFAREGMDCLWVAMKKGLCVVRRDARDHHSHRIVQRILAEKVEQVSPGFWFPTEFRSQVFAQDPKADEETVEGECTFRILRCALNNDVPLSIFTATHRPGSLRFETPRRFEQVLPGGNDLLSDVVDYMVKYAHLPTKPTGHSNVLVLCACFLGAAASGLFLGLFLVRYAVRVKSREE